MAKVNRTIDEAIDEVFKDYKKAFKVAAQEASEAARDDLYANTVSCLVRYYEDYDPTSYNRTYSLMESFVPYVNPVRESGDSLLCSAGVEFDPARIANTYYGSEIYSPVDSGWIIENFLAGIHPRTDGSPIVGGGNYEDQNTMVLLCQQRRCKDLLMDIGVHLIKILNARLVLKFYGR